MGSEGENSKKSAPLSSNASIRARGSNLPRSVWRLRAGLAAAEANLALDDHRGL